MKMRHRTFGFVWSTPQHLRSTQGVQRLHLPIFCVLSAGGLLLQRKNGMSEEVDLQRGAGVEKQVLRYAQDDNVMSILRWRPHFHGSRFDTRITTDLELAK